MGYFTLKATMANKRALLINPPIYDVQYWAEWSQPHGLLKIGNFLRQKGYEIRLIDCLFPNNKRNVSKKTKSVIEICSSRPEIPYNDFHKVGGKLKPNQRLKFIFGTTPEDLRRELLAMIGLVDASSGRNQQMRLSSLFPETFYPDEVWITSIMTYWWESTVDVAVLCKEVFPSARLRIGGIYPTLASDHLQQKLAKLGIRFEVVLGHNFELSDQRDLVVVGEIPEASWSDLDFDLYYQPDIPNSRYYHGPQLGELGYETAITDRRFYAPPYAILTTTRGCPFDCAYCAQRAYNLYDNREVSQALWVDEKGRKQPVRTREVKEVLGEIREKFHHYGTRQFAFYEDNFLVRKEHFRTVLQEIVDAPDLRGNLHLYAPEGVEVRLIDSDLAKIMHQAGFERVYLPLENINTEVIRSWNRSHSNIQMFERAVQNCVDAGFILRNMQVNAFLLFGTPGEDIRNVVDSVIFASSRIGSVIPMLFTPVPGSAIFEEYREYLFDEMGYDLQHLNGKLFPFLAFNQRLSTKLALQDYLDLEALMFRVNAQAVRGTFDIGGESKVSKAFREIITRV
jgi:hypothetical protein